MSDLNAALETIADYIADRVVAKLAAQDGTDWPALETKVLIDEGLLIQPFQEAPTVYNYEGETLGDVTKPVGKKESKRTFDKINDPVATRKLELAKVNVQTLRNNISAVEDKPVDFYKDNYSKKDDLVAYIADFEALTGKTLEQQLDDGLEAAGLKVEKKEKVESEPVEVADDTDYSVPETPDEEVEEELTYEVALTLDVATLKTLAIDNDFPADKLVGLDVEALAALLFDKTTEEPEAAPAADAEEDDEMPTEEELRQSSIGELKAFADQINVQEPGTVEYNRSTTEEELAEIIISLIY